MMRTTSSTFFLLLMIGLTAILSGCKGDSSNATRITYDKAVPGLTKLVDDVSWSQNLVTRKALVSLDKSPDLGDTLPEIDKFDLVVTPVVFSNSVVTEIFVSTEKSGTGTDGWLVKVADAFNKAQKRLRGGKIAQVQIRKIASGTGYQFIASGRHIPDAFSPSNHLWLRMVEAHGTPIHAVSERLVENTAGIVMKEKVQETLQSKYGTVTVKHVVDAVVQGSFAMGYTNPFASSTGLNFLVTVLSTFAAGDENNMLSGEVVSAFEAFQQGVPFVSLTTLQMRESVQNDGSLDAFIMEHQTFVNTTVLQKGYTFIPFGIKHDNPLYGIGNLSSAKKEVLQQFAQYTAQPRWQKLATDYGFNRAFNYQPEFQPPAGNVLIQSQKVWKEKKDVGRPLVGVFLADVSGSMKGLPLKRLKEALIQGSNFITAQNAIGLVVFSDRVIQRLPIRKFDLLHRASFVAAVQDMDANGGTAMYDGIVASLKLLVGAKDQFPNSKPMLFVLTDGETNAGLEFKKVARVIAGLRIPIYTIGYNADISVLKQLSALNEAASLNADDDDIAYRIGALLNAQM